ncbi:MAG: hypothetical protein LBT86_09925 [Deltaproteobacteria bacterium]|jgi:hypothetical protein|nr:hypothetical protein [Deltaproteobacteria bacterium]
MTPKAKELLDRDLYVYNGILIYLEDAQLRIKLELETATRGYRAELWKEMAKLNAVNNGLKQLTQRLYEEFLEGQIETSSPIDEAE